MGWRQRFIYSLFYLRRPPWDTGITPPEVVAFVQQAPPGRALDLGCGTGTNAIYLAQHNWQVSGVDFVGKAIRQAQRKAQRAGVSVDFHQGDVTRLEGTDGPFDLVLDIGCFHSLAAPGREAYRHNLERLLKPGGTFLLYGFTKSDATDSAGPGVSEADIQQLSRPLRLVKRSGGSDRGRRSAWFTFERPAG